LFLCREFAAYSYFALSEDNSMQFRGGWKLLIGREIEIFFGGGVDRKLEDCDFGLNLDLESEI
jgi:hypothetical protein